MVYGKYDKHGTGNQHNMCHVHIPLKKYGGCKDVPRFNKCICIYRRVLSVQNIMCSICQLKSYCIIASCCMLHVKRGLAYHIVNTHKQLCYRQLWVISFLKRVAKDGRSINLHASLPMKFTHHPLMWLSWCVNFCQTFTLLMDFHCISLYINEDVTWKIREYNL